MKKWSISAITSLLFLTALGVTFANDDNCVDLNTVFFTNDSVKILKTIELIKNSITTDTPSDAQLEALADGYRKLRMHEERLAAVNQLVERYPTSRPYLDVKSAVQNSIAKKFSSKNDLENARFYFQASFNTNEIILNLYPHFLSARMRQAQLHALLNNPKEAKEAYFKIHNELPHNEAVLLALINLLQDQATNAFYTGKESASLIAELKTMLLRFELNIADGPSKAQHITRNNAALKQLTDAIQAYQKEKTLKEMPLRRIEEISALPQEQVSEDILVELAKLFEQTSQWENAYFIVDLLIKNSPQEIKYYLWKAERQLAQGYYLNRKTVEGQQQQQAGKELFEAALTTLQKAQDIDHNDTDLLRVLFKTQLALKNNDKALELMDRYHLLRPSDTSALETHLGTLLAEALALEKNSGPWKEKISKAMKLIERLDWISPDSSETLRFQILFNNLLGQVDQVIYFGSKYVASGRTDYHALYSYAGALRLDGGYHQAIDVLHKALKTKKGEKNKHRIFGLLGHSYFQIGKYEQAKEYLGMALQGKDKRSNTRQLLAKSYVMLGQYDTAIQLFQQLESKRPTFSVLKALLEVYEILKDRRNIEIYLAKIEKLEKLKDMPKY